MTDTRSRRTVIRDTMHDVIQSIEWLVPQDDVDGLEFIRYFRWHSIAELDHKREIWATRQNNIMRVRNQTITRLDNISADDRVEIEDALKDRFMTDINPDMIAEFDLYIRSEEYMLRRMIENDKDLMNQAGRYGVLI